MTTQDKLQAIREKCIKANPEIVELKPGCSVIYGSEPDEPRPVVIGQPYTVEFGKVFNPWNRDDGGELVEVLGRPVTLADVLLAIGISERAHAFNLDVYGGWAFMFWSRKDGYSKNVKYDLRADSLEDQSPETIDFIHSIILPK